jgi:hypothetical protein
MPSLPVADSPEAVVQRLLRRPAMGNIVIDYEEVSRTFPEGPGKVDLVAIYEVVDGLIRSQTVQVSNERLDAQAG